MQYADRLIYFPRYGFVHEPTMAQNPPTVFGNLWAVATTFYLVAIFTGWLAKLLREKEKEIAIERDKVEAIIQNLSDGLLYLDKNKVFNLIPEDCGKRFIDIIANYS